MKDEFKSYVEMVCSLCSKMYLRHREHPFKKTCSVCWKESKSIPLTDSDMTIRYLQNIYFDCADKESQIEKQHIKIESLKIKIIRLKKIMANSSLYSQVENTKYKLSKSISRKLLSLCHPDKHKDSETAKEITQWILENR